MGQHIQHGLPCRNPSCGSSDAMVEYPETFHCFSCHATYLKNYDEIKQSKNQAQDSVVNCVEYPKSLTLDPKRFSLDALAWLYRYRVYDDLIKEYSIGYVKEEDRVFIPNFDKDGNLISYQTRALNKYDSIKYLGVGRKGIYVSHTLQKTPTLVIVEDAMSCIRVGEVSSCIALQGSALSRTALEDIINDDFSKIIIWLDGDKAGIEGAQKLQLQLGQFKPATSIRTSNDPKCYTRGEIKKILEQAENNF